MSVCVCERAGHMALCPLFSFTIDDMVSVTDVIQAPFTAVLLAGSALFVFHGPVGSITAK